MQSIHREIDQQSSSRLW